MLRYHVLITRCAYATPSIRKERCVQAHRATSALREPGRGSRDAAPQRPGLPDVFPLRLAWSRSGDRDVVRRRKRVTLPRSHHLRLRLGGCHERLCDRRACDLWQWAERNVAVLDGAAVEGAVARLAAQRRQRLRRRVCDRSIALAEGGC